MEQSRRYSSTNISSPCLSSTADIFVCQWPCFFVHLIHSDGSIEQSRKYSLSNSYRHQRSVPVVYCRYFRLASLILQMY
jgi:hypothetical protein